MKANKPAFSVIMTSFNYGRYIGAAIESVLAQTFADWELLIVDDCSTDESWDVIQSFKDPRIIGYQQTTNSGASAAYNRAFHEAQGKYVACLDSDDLFAPTKLEAQDAFLRENPDVDVCGSYVFEIDAAGNSRSKGGSYATWFNVDIDLNDPARWIWENRLCHSSAIVRADMHRRIGNFAENLKYTPDWQFWIRGLVAGARFSVLNEPLVAYRNHGDNITHRDPLEAIRERAGSLSQIFIPWLQDQGRLDIVDDAIAGYIRNLHVASSASLGAEVARQLFSGNGAIPAGEAALRLLATRFSGDTEESRWRMQMRVEELTNANSWHLEQRNAWEKVSKNQAQSIEELNSRLKDLTLELESTQSQLSNIRAHWLFRLLRRLPRSIAP